MDQKISLIQTVIINQALFGSPGADYLARLQVTENGSLGDPLLSKESLY